jgi:hypothetical protein
MKIENDFRNLISNSMSHGFYLFPFVFVTDTGPSKPDR